MIKKILSILLCLSMAVCMLAGCGAKEADTANDKQIKAADKLEKQYVERIEAYQEYFKQAKTDDSNDVIGGTITLDSDGLPLMWLGMRKDGSKENPGTQLIGYEDGNAVILAERSEYIIPYRSLELILAAGNADGDMGKNIYLYDAEKKDFRIINSKLEDLYNKETVYSEEELDEALQFLSPILEGMKFYNSMQIVVNESSHQIAYWGKTDTDMNFEALKYMNVIDAMVVSDISIGGYYLPNKYADNEVALRCFEKLADAELDEDMREILLHEYASGMYRDTIKSPYNSLCIAADGTVLSATEYESRLSLVQDKGWRLGDGNKPFNDVEMGQLLRGLANKPLFSEEELYLYICSVGYNCEIVEIDWNEYTLSKASDDFVGAIVSEYVIGDYYEKIFFTTELEENHDALLATEPYKTIREEGVDERSYVDNVLTISLGNNEYQFQIEFDDSGEMVSGMTYIDPTASMSEEEKQEYVVKTEVIPAYEKYIENEFGGFSEYAVYNLIYIDEDDIPEMLCDNTADGRGTKILCYKDGEVYSNDAICRGFAFSYIPKKNKVWYTHFWLGDEYSSVAHLEDGTLIEEHNCFFKLDQETGDGGTYQIDGQECSEEEYDDFIDTYFRYEGMVDGWETHSSIQEAYENLGKIRYNDVMYDDTEFSLTLNKLKAKTKVPYEKLRDV